LENALPIIAVLATEEIVTVDTGSEKENAVDWRGKEQAGNSWLS
jgi:hypothetical protein